MPKGYGKKNKLGSKRGRSYGIEGDKAAPLSREGRNDRHDTDRERVDNQAPLSNEGREIV